MDENSRYCNNRTIITLDNGTPCPSAHYCPGHCMHSYWLSTSLKDDSCPSCLVQGSSDEELHQDVMLPDLQAKNFTEGVLLPDLQAKNFTDRVLSMTFQVKNFTENPCYLTCWQKKFDEKAIDKTFMEKNNSEKVFDMSFEEKKCSKMVFDETFVVKKHSKMLLDKTGLVKIFKKKSCNMTICRRTSFEGLCQYLQTKNFAERLWSMTFERRTSSGFMVNGLLSKDFSRKSCSRLFIGHFEMYDDRFFSASLAKMPYVAWSSMPKGLPLRKSQRCNCLTP